MGLILAGGLGRRMRSDAGAQPKPLVLLDGIPLIAHVIARLRPQVSDVWINANGPAQDFAAFGCRIVPDTVPGRPGPLAGVLAGLDTLAGERPGSDLLAVPADTPFLPDDLCARLQSRRAEAQVVCAGSGGQRHPVVALWSPSVRTALRQSLAEGRLKVGLLLDRLEAVTQMWDAVPADPFFNVNTPQDLAVAQARAAARE